PACRRCRPAPAVSRAQEVSNARIQVFDMNASPFRRPIRPLTPRYSSVAKFLSAAPPLFPERICLYTESSFGNDMRTSGSFLLGAVACVTFSVCVTAQVENKSIRPLNAAHKVALVIGNSNYAYVPKIPPAVNDAADMAGALRKLGFDVDLKTDLGGEALVEAVVRFSRGKVQSGDVAFVYYSGHGGQVAGENFLLPIDYQPPSEDELVERRAYKMSLVRDALERTGASVRVLIFDACRDSPVTSSKGVASGLHGISGKAEGTLIAFASADNQVARYETGQRNSFYTAELLTALNQSPGDLKTLL